jgi:hypothetical protein
MEEVYDALSQAQKHIMLKNGMFEFELSNFKQPAVAVNQVSNMSTALSVAS